MQTREKNMITTKMIELLKWSIAAFGGWLLAFIMPIAPFLVLTLSLVLCDLFTGTRAAVHRGETLHSKGFRRSIEKISLYFVGILLARGVEQVFEFDWSFPYVVTFLIMLTEIKSNFENISQVTGVDLWANIVQKLPSITDIMSKKVPGKKTDESSAESTEIDANN